MRTETRLSDEAIANEILNIATQRIVTWHELSAYYKTRGISVSRLRRILATLIVKKELIEIKCRLLTTPEYIKRKTKEELKNEISETLKKIGLKKCGKYIVEPDKRFIIKIEKNRTIVIFNEQ
jgi:hypothetical protein